jgi:hypothetical protein
MALCAFSVRIIVEKMGRGFAQTWQTRREVELFRALRWAAFFSLVILSTVTLELVITGIVCQPQNYLLGITAYRFELAGCKDVSGGRQAAARRRSDGAALAAMPDLRRAAKWIGRAPSPRERGVQTMGMDRMTT